MSGELNLKMEKKLDCCPSTSILCSHTFQTAERIPHQRFVLYGLLVVSRVWYSSDLMCIYLPDTNVLIDFGRDLLVREKIECAAKKGARFLIGPPTVIELVRGMIAHGHKTFEKDKQVFVWIRDQDYRILELPRPFMAKILKTSAGKTSGVVPEHYKQLISMIVGAANFPEFLEKSETPASVWNEIKHSHQIHEAILDREHRALVGLAKGRPDKFLPQRLSQTFGAPGCRPNPLVLKRHFSAAIEFLESVLAKVRGGAKPRKNDPGLYIDFQLLLYLADPAITFLTNENFSQEIRRSPQRFRIRRLESLC
jgi:hypothetical protein